MNFKKKFVKIIVTLAIFCLAYFGYKIATFSIFEDEADLIAEIENFGALYKIRVYHIPTNATTNSSIQLRKFENKKEIVISSYDKYNKLDSYNIKIDTLYLSISDVNKSVQPQKIKLNFK